MDNDIWLEYIKGITKLDDADKLKPKKAPIIIKKSDEDYSSQDLFANKIDLHGLTKDQAFDALKAFIHNSYRNRKYKVLIVTGKGNPNSQETIKNLVPRWLEHTELKQYIVDYWTAPLKLGGSGAIQVVIKKNN